MRLPKCDWLFIYSVSRVTLLLLVAERKRREVQAVPEKVLTRNALYVADVGKNSSVNMAKTTPPNGRVHRDYPVVQLTITEQKFSSRKKKLRQIMESIKSTETFNFIIIIRSYFAFYTFVGSLW